MTSLDSIVSMRCAEKINIVGAKFEFMRLLSKALNEIEVNSSVRILHGRAEFARGIIFRPLCKTGRLLRFKTR